MAAPVLSQGQDKPDINKYKAAQLADYAFRTANYYTAIDLYLQLNRLEPENQDYAYRLGESFYAVRDYENARDWYSKTIKINSSKYTIAKLKYASILKVLGEYDTATGVFKNFYKVYKDTNPELYRSIALKEIEDCKFSLATVKDTLPVNVLNAGRNVNTSNSNFSPLPDGEKNFIFSSMAVNRLVNLAEKGSDTLLVKLYRGTIQDNGQVSVQEYTDGPFNSKQVHTANGTFSLDRKRFFFNRCQTDANEKMICAIYMSEQKDGKWGNPFRMGPQVNDEKYSTTQPGIGTNSKNEEVLFFTSDRPGGRGGSDIWFSIKARNTSDYSPAVNLGPNINTAGDEKSPYYDFATQTLYFSSDGWKSYGGLDVFKSRWNVVSWDVTYISKRPDSLKASGTVTRWSAPENMGIPINSSYDDFGFVLSERDAGYLVSNRPGGLASGGSSCCDDIYRFKYTNEAVYNALRDSISKIKSVTPSIVSSDTSRLDFHLSDKLEKDKTYTLTNIYFDFDKFTLRPDSKDEMERLVDFLSDTPTLIVEVSAHTDSIGLEDYNLRLSQKRAETIVQYLVSRGIPKKRLTAKGYGESRPIAPNTTPDGSDNFEGQQMNRRVEFRVTGELGKKKPEENKLPQPPR